MPHVAIDARLVAQEPDGSAAAELAKLTLKYAIEPTSNYHDATLSCA